MSEHREGWGPPCKHCQRLALVDVSKEMESRRKDLGVLWLDYRDWDDLGRWVEQRIRELE